MSTESEGRVAVYIDFDNIVISRYNQLHGRGAFQSDRVRDIDPTTPGNRAASNGASGEGNAGSGKSGQTSGGKSTGSSTSSASDSASSKGAVSAESNRGGRGAPALGTTLERLGQATVDIGAVLDYASSFGQIVVSRAYADWSQPVNAGYRRQLVDRAIDLTQMFPLSATKNGADIRLAIDVVEDLFRLSDVTHVVLVAGDSDYVALAQRVKRLGRTIVAVGVSGATSRALPAACNDFSLYDDLPGISGDDLDEGDDPADADELDGAAGSRGSGAPRHASGSVSADAIDEEIVPGESAALRDAERSGESVTDEQEPDAAGPKKSRAKKSPTQKSNSASGSASSSASSSASTSTSAAAATDSSTSEQDTPPTRSSRRSGRRSSTTRSDDGSGNGDSGAADTSDAGDSANGSAADSDANGATDANSSGGPDGAGDADEATSATKMSARAATTLLRRALALGHDSNGDDWLHTSAVKQQIKRLDPSFREKTLGYGSFTDFVKSRSRIAELEKESNGQRVRLRSRRSASS